MRQVFQLWQFLSDSGCLPDRDPRERRRIRISNQYSIMVGSFLLLLFPLTFYRLKQEALILATFATSLCYFLIPLLNRFAQNPRAGRYVTIGLFSLFTVVYCLILGPGAGVELIFIPCIGAPFVILNFKKKISFVLSALIPISCYYFVIYYGFDLVEPIALDPEARKTIYSTVVPYLFLVIFALSGYFTMINQINEKELEHTIEDLVLSRQEIENQKVRLAAASRLSAIGELSGSIAHEVNNPLSIIKGFANQLETLASRDALEQDRLILVSQKISATVDRISKIVLGLRKLSREGENDPTEVVDIRQIIDEVLTISSEGFKKLAIDVRFQALGEPCYCLCRPVQIAQVLLNLIHNARDAVEALEEKWIAVDIRTIENILYVSVTDSGKGLSSDVLRCLGQPFFTTKPRGKGTGLGFTISKRIMLAHGGDLEVDPLSAHTRFILSIERAPQQPMIMV